MAKQPKWDPAFRQFHILAGDQGPKDTEIVLSYGRGGHTPSDSPCADAQKAEGLGEISNMHEEHDQKYSFGPRRELLGV